MRYRLPTAFAAIVLAVVGAVLGMHGPVLNSHHLGHQQPSAHAGHVVAAAHHAQDATDAANCDASEHQCVATTERGIDLAAPMEIRASVLAQADGTRIDPIAVTTRANSPPDLYQLSVSRT